MWIGICRAAEIGSAHLKVLTEEKGVHVVKSSEESAKSAIKKEEKEYMRAGMAGMNLSQFCGYRHKRGCCLAFGKTFNVCHDRITFPKSAKQPQRKLIHLVTKVPGIFNVVFFNYAMNS